MIKTKILKNSKKYNKRKIKGGAELFNSIKERLGYSDGGKQKNIKLLNTFNMLKASKTPNIKN